jgi:hypothetical protein
MSPRSADTTSLVEKRPQLRTFRHLMAAHREKCGDTAPCLQNHASSSDIIERMAAHIRSDRILRSGDSFGYPLVDSGNFPSSRVAAVCALSGTPAISAAVAGWTLGKPLLDPARVCTPRSAALRGAVIASFALLLFAPLFASLYIWTQAVTEHWSMLSLTFLVFIGSALAAWFKVALTGAASVTRGRASLES